MTRRSAHVGYRAFASGADLRAGRCDGADVHEDALVLTRPVRTTVLTDPYGDGTPVSYESAAWTSPEVSPGFAFDQLVASWDAVTPPGTFVEVAVRGTADDGTRTGDYVLARWASDTSTIHRHSVDDQGDDVATVQNDTWVTRDGRTLRSWQLVVTLHRRAGTDVSPAVRYVGAFASVVPDEPHDADPSPPGAARGTVLDVPTYSQELHVGEYPELDGGGEAWCSPTSTSMVLAYWQRRLGEQHGPVEADWAWVDPTYADPWVDHAADRTYDHTYGGTGNWAFNTAYAAQFGHTAFVTRLRSLAEAELFVAAGIPLIVSASFGKHELDGAGYDTRGHLMVLVGFDEHGHPVVNDPASHLVGSDDEVRVTYDRQQLEAAWSRSGRTVYVIRPASVRLPAPPNPAEPNW